MKKILFSLVMLVMTATAAWADVYPTSSADVGKVICSDGTIYATVAEATAAGKTAEAMIAYVNEEFGTPRYGKALAISLADAPIEDIDKGVKHDAALILAEEYNTTHAIARGTWRLPTVQDWENMFIACGSTSTYKATLPNNGLLTEDYEFYSGNIREMMIAAGGSAFYDNAYGYGYWSDTELSTMKGTWWTYYFTFPPNGDDFICGFTPSVLGHVRPCVEFYVGTPRNLSLQEGTEDAEHWTISSNPVLSGRIGTLYYTGNRVVKSVKLLNAGTDAYTPYSSMLRRPQWSVTMPDFDDVAVIEYDDSYNVLSYNEDNSVKIDELNGTTTDVVINRVLPQGWSILSLPFDLPGGFKPNLGLSAKEFTGSTYTEGNGADYPSTVKLYFEDVTDLKANTPYLVLAQIERDLFNFPFTDVTVSNVNGDVKTKYANFIATNSQTTVTDDPRKIRCIRGSYIKAASAFEQPYAYSPGFNPVIDGLSGYMWLSVDMPDMDDAASSGVSVQIVFDTYVPEEEPAIIGDTNGDGVVNGTDIQEIINLIVAGKYDESADINKDGKVNGTDIQEIINIIVEGK